MQKEFEIDRSKRFEMYKQLVKLEPRMWTKNHHLIRMFTNSLTINMTIFAIYKIYYKYYMPDIGLVGSILQSNKMKIMISSIFIINGLLFYFNYSILHELIYESYYSHLTNKDFYIMYENMISSKRKSLK